MDGVHKMKPEHAQWENKTAKKEKCFGPNFYVSPESISAFIIFTKQEAFLFQGGGGAVMRKILSVLSKISP